MNDNITKATEGRKIVDGACYCKDCTGRTTEFYHLEAHCSNCATGFILKLRKGDKPSVSQECPHCGVSFSVHTRGLVNV